MSGQRIPKVGPQSRVQQTERTSGTLGGRRVEQKPSEAPRLDRIRGTAPPKGNIFVRRFESVETKISRTARSLDTQTGNLLGALKREPGGHIGMQNVLGAMKTLRLHSERLSQLHGTQVDHVDTLQVAMAGRFASMDNREVLDTFSTFMSEDMTRLRAILERETQVNPGNAEAKHALEDLGVIEATVMMEISTRVARSRAGEGEVVPSLQERLFESSTNPGKEVLQGLYQKRELSVGEQKKRLSDRDLETLVNAGGRSSAFRQRLQTQGRQLLDRKGLQQMDLRDVGDGIRGSDLTVNFSLKNFLGIGRQVSPVREENRLYNVFQRGRRPQDNEGAQKRDLTERGFFPSLEKDPLDPDSRPLYGALNVGRQTVGGAGEGYGGAYFVLKSQVKQRCTFTRDDTFNVSMCSVNQKNLERFTKGLDGVLGRLSQTAQKKFAENGGALRQKLLDFFGARKGAQPFTVLKLPQSILGALVDQVGASVPGVTEQDFDVLGNYAEEVFRDNDATREQVVGFDDVESLLPFLGGMRLDRLMTAVTNRSLSDVRIGNYIEAQIHGPVSFSEDVAALRLGDSELRDTAKALVKSRHPEEENYAPSRQELDDAREEIRLQLEEFCERNGIELEIYDEREIDKQVDVSETVLQEFSETHKDVFEETERFTSSSSTKEGSFQSILARVSKELHFTGNLTEKELHALTVAISDAAQERLGEDRTGLSSEFLGEVAPDVIQRAIQQRMEETRKAGDKLLYSFVDSSRSDPDSFAGVLKAVKTERNFDLDLNPANLQRLGENIAKAFGKLNTGSEPVTAEKLKEVARQEIEAFIATKQKLLGTLDELQFAKPEYKERWRSFVLASSTLRDPEMLKCLHAQSLQAQQMMEAFNSQGGFEPERFLTALAKFTTIAGFAQLDVHNQLGRDLARDDRYLFLDRVLSLAVTTMDLDKVKMQALYDHLTGGDVAAMRRFVVKEGVDALLAGNMSDTLHLLAQNLGKGLGIERSVVDEAMSGRLKEAEQLQAPSQTLRQALDRTVKVQTLAPFPPPGKNVNMSFEQFRKEELPGILDLYLQNEKTFDRTLVHGRMHISRALIYTRVLANVYWESGLAPNTHALYRAIAFHDSGRKSNGSDVYEKLSGERLAQYLKTNGIESNSYVLSSSSCITCGKNIQTLEEGIMNSSDAFEILRTRGRQGFDVERLWFMRSPVRSSSGQLVEPNTVLRDALLDEIDAFIRLTDLPRPQEQVDLEQAMARGETNDEVLTDLQTKAKEAQQRQLEKEWATPNNEYFGGVEQVLLKNKEKFPLLSKYYAMGD